MLAAFLRQSRTISLYANWEQALQRVSTAIHGRDTATTAIARHHGQDRVDDAMAEADAAAIRYDEWRKEWVRQQSA